MNDAQWQYVEGQGRPGFPALFGQFESLSATAAPDGTLDIRYGEAARETFDFFPAQGEAKATLLYFHAGYWQSRDKAMFRFIAPAFTPAGVHVALVNYPLCPHVSIGSLVHAAQRATVQVRAHVKTLGRGDLPLVASGHSAGGHIAVELGLTNWARLDRPSRGIDGVVALSGVFDLTPLIGTTLNANLGLDADSAIGYSPVLRTSRAPAALIVVGGAETPAFIEQSRRMHQAWQGVGNQSVLQVVDGADHFSLLAQLVLPTSALHGSVIELIAQAQRSFGA